MIHFPKLGITIKDSTPKEEVARLRAKHPEVERAVAAREAKQKKSVQPKPEKGGA